MIRHPYDNGRAFGHGYATAYGAQEAASGLRALERRGIDSGYLAGMCDAILDFVQTREELAPGCYRVRRAGGAE